MTVVPQVGQSVPEFTVESTDGTLHSADFHGKNLVLYFYPKDNTPGCTQSSIDFRNLIAEFEKANTVIVGVSRDSMKSHDGFKQRFELPFALISDPEEKLCTLFGVMKDKKRYGKMVRGIERSTFLMDAKGKLVREWRNLKVPGHVDEVLEAAQALAKVS